MVICQSELFDAFLLLIPIQKPYIWSIMQISTEKRNQFTIFGI